jgi:hypothetical protein
VAVQQFNELRAGVLLGPIEWLSRGFNLPCEAMIVLDQFSNLWPSTLLQLVGRLRRVESPFKTTELHILQGAPISTRELAFHGLYAGTALVGRSNKEFLKLAKWFHLHPRVHKTPEGKRRPLPYCRNLEEYRALFADLFPRDAACVKEIDERHLIVETP